MKRSLQYIGISWLIILTIESFRDILQGVPLLFVIYIPVYNLYIFSVRVVVMTYYFRRLQVQKGYLNMLIRLVFALFTVLYLSFIYIFSSAIRCVFLVNDCIPSPSFEELRILDIIANIFYITTILCIDIIFMVRISQVLCRSYGGKSALLNRPFIFHLILQLCILFSMIMNVMRLILIIPGGNIQILSPFWMYPDTFLILSLFDYGTSYVEVTRNSVKDTTPQELQIITQEMYEVQLTKDNILRYLHHSLRNRIQIYDYMLESLKVAIMREDKDLTRNILHSLEQIKKRFVTLIEDVQKFNDIKKNSTVVDNAQHDMINIAELVQNELWYLQTSSSYGDSIGESESNSNSTTPKIEVVLPQEMWVTTNRNLVCHLIDLLYENFVEYNLSKNLKIFISDSTLVFEIYTNFTEIEYMENELEQFFLISYQIMKDIVNSLDGNIKNTMQNMVISVPLLEASIDIHIIPSTAAAIVKIDYKILIVDDSLINRKLLNKLILNILPTDLNVIIDEAENGRQAIEKVEELARYSDGQIYDLVFLDVMMPVMDGRETCIEIKRKYNNIPIVMVTANEESTLKNIPYDAYMQKPLMKEKIKDVLRRYNLPIV